MNLNPAWNIFLITNHSTFLKLLQFHTKINLNKYLLLLFFPPLLMETLKLIMILEDVFCLKELSYPIWEEEEKSSLNWKTTTRKFKIFNKQKYKFSNIFEGTMLQTTSTAELQLSKTETSKWQWVLWRRNMLRDFCRSIFWKSLRRESQVCSR